MDDNELDRLFGEGNDSEEGSSDKAKSPETESDKKEPQDNEVSDDDAKENGFVVSHYEGPSEEDETDEDSEESAEEETEDDESEDVEDSEEDKESEEEEPEEKEEKSAPSRPAPKKKPAPAPDDRARTRAKNEPESQVSLKDIIPLNGKSIAAICLALVVVVMVVLIAFLPAFRVRNCHVEGNVVLSDQQVLAEAGLTYDAHLMSGISGNIFDILSLDYGKTEQRMKQENPYIEDIRISIKLPSTVNIHIKERSKVCYIRTPDGYAALDKDGIVLELSSFDSNKDVRPVICGLNVKSAEMGKKVKLGNMNDYKKAIIVLGAILAADNASVGGDYSMFENTSEVRILPSGYMFLTIYSPSGHLIQIKLNSLETISDDMAWLLYAFNSDAFDKITVSGALDMTDIDKIFREYE